MLGEVSNWSLRDYGNGDAINTGDEKIDKESNASHAIRAVNLKFDKTTPYGINISGELEIFKSTNYAELRVKQLKCSSYRHWDESNQAIEEE